MEHEVNAQMHVSKESSDRHLHHLSPLYIILIFGIIIIFM